MPTLPPDHLDALTEQVNICSGRAAQVLSRLLNRRILLNVPEVFLCPLEEVPSRMDRLVGGEVFSVHQHFNGDLVGDIFLLLRHRHAFALLALLTGDLHPPVSLNASDYEALTEMGNIVLTAFLGNFAGLLGMRVYLSVPQFRVDTLRAIFRLLPTGMTGVRYAVVVRVRFRVSSEQVEGHIVLVLEAGSLQDVLNAEIFAQPERT